MAKPTTVNSISIEIQRGNVFSRSFLCNFESTCHRDMSALCSSKHDAVRARVLSPGRCGALKHSSRQLCHCRCVQAKPSLGTGRSPEAEPVVHVCKV